MQGDYNRPTFSEPTVMMSGPVFYNSYGKSERTYY